VCKLNGADLKFLNQANSESREAMKRSKNVASVPGKFNGTNALRFEIEERIRAETLRRTFSSHHLAPFSSTHHQIFSFDLISRSVLFDFQLTTYRLLSLTSSFFFITQWASSRRKKRSSGRGSDGREKRRSSAL
jgi:hypothetical protein